MSFIFCLLLLTDSGFAQKAVFKSTGVDSITITAFTSAGLSEYKGKSAAVNNSETIIIYYNEKENSYKVKKYLHLKSVYYWKKKKGVKFKPVKKKTTTPIDFKNLSKLLQSLEANNIKSFVDSNNYRSFIDNIDRYLMDEKVNGNDIIGTLSMLSKDSFLQKFKNIDTIQNYFSSIVDTTACGGVLDFTRAFTIDVFTKDFRTTFESRFPCLYYQPWSYISSTDSISDRGSRYNLMINQALYDMLPVDFYLRTEFSPRSISKEYVWRMTNKYSRIKTPYLLLSPSLSPSSD